MAKVSPGRVVPDEQIQVAIAVEVRGYNCIGLGCVLIGPSLIDIGLPEWRSEYGVWNRRLEGSIAIAQENRNLWRGVVVDDCQIDFAVLVVVTRGESDGSSAGLNLSGRAKRSVAFA